MLNVYVPWVKLDTVTGVQTDGRTYTGMDSSSESLQPRGLLVQEPLCHNLYRYFRETCRWNIPENKICIKNARLVRPLHMTYWTNKWPYWCLSRVDHAGLGHQVMAGCVVVPITIRIVISHLSESPTLVIICGMRQQWHSPWDLLQIKWNSWHCCGVPGTNQLITEYHEIELERANAECKYSYTTGRENRRK